MIEIRTLNKILVYHPFSRSIRDGGPSGFIAQNLDTLESKFLSVTPGLDGAKIDFVDRLRTLHYGKYSLSQKSAVASNMMRWRKTGAAAYKALWFHDAGMFATCSPWVSTDQYIIYQPHCPELPWNEFGDDRTATKVEAITRHLFKRADLIVLPNPGCVSIYHDLVDPNKLAFLTSGCMKAPGFTRVPLDRSFVYFLFIGRRNHIKGFDVLLNGFTRASASRANIRLILCGKGEKVNHPAIIDLGPSDRIHDWIASSDCVINVNRQSYFDLSVMETLSVGVPVALTATNGHAELVGRSPGIFPIEPDEDAVCSFFKKFAPSQVDVCMMRDANVRLFHSVFASNKYHERAEALFKVIASRFR